MDTPLYVLSTAASMVESVDVAKCQNMEEASLKRVTTEPSSSAKTLTMAACPVSDHYQLCGSGQDINTGSLQTLSDNRRKCAGTQTSFSSFGSSPYGLAEKYVRMSPATSSPPPPPPAYYQHHNTMAPTPGQQVASYGGHSLLSDGRRGQDDDTDCEMPLNLTKSSSSHQSNLNAGSNASMSPTSASPSSPSSPSSVSSRQSPTPSRHALAQQSARLSVIIRNGPSQRPGSDGVQLPGNASRDGRMLGNCDDPEIEEHFRRSLGTKYQSYMTSCSSPRNGETPDTTSSCPSNVSITGNVDDHFAKSLGETWTQLNAQRQSSLTGTVDDHFAKALGETWYKIKAKVETESRGPAGVVPL